MVLHDALMMIGKQRLVVALLLLLLLLGPVSVRILLLISTLLHMMWRRTVTRDLTLPETCMMHHLAAWSIPAGDVCKCSSSPMLGHAILKISLHWTCLLQGCIYWCLGGSGSHTF